MRMNTTEKKVLFKKYTEVDGLDFESADVKIKLVQTHLSNLMEELREKGMSEENMNIKFKEEFAKLVERDEKQPRKIRRKKHG